MKQFNLAIQYLIENWRLPLLVILFYEISMIAQYLNYSINSLPSYLLATFLAFFSVLFFFILPQLFNKQNMSKNLELIVIIQLLWLNLKKLIIPIISLILLASMFFIVIAFIAIFNFNAPANSTVQTISLFLKSVLGLIAFSLVSTTISLIMTTTSVFFEETDRKFWRSVIRTVKFYAQNTSLLKLLIIPFLLCSLFSYWYSYWFLGYPKPLLLDIIYYFITQSIYTVLLVIIYQYHKKISHR